MDIFMCFDKVTYVGEKHRSDLRGKIGVIEAKVDRGSDSFVVDFGKHAYVMHSSKLSHWKSSNREEEAKVELEVYRRRSPVQSEDD